MGMFYLVRHGLKKQGTGDVPLSGEGAAQARATARHFRQKKITSVYASPLRRAAETAAFIAMELGYGVTEDSRLRERANWGDLPGQTFEQFVAMWNRCTRDREYIPPVGDSARKAGERLESFIRECAEQDPDCAIAAVTHGGLITDFLINIFPEQRLEQLYPGFLAAQSRLIPECSITAVRYDRGTFEVELFASTAHLTGGGEDKNDD